MALAPRTTSSTGDALVDFDAALEAFDPALGIEVHVELNTATKMFCGCPTTFGAEANTQTCPVCLGLPGALPMVNAKAIESAIRLGLALNCDIASWSHFARKNYFYPDMPKNFQTSQSDEPIDYDGYLDVTLEDGEIFRVPIERAHMEEDTGKSTHLGGATGHIHGATASLVDYNRAGIPLIEVVTRPILGAKGRTPEIARAYVSALRDLVVALNISDARMDQGSIRADVNLSLRLVAADGNQDAVPLGTRTETKNVNSLRSIERAVRYEVSRQAAILDDGGTIVQETRHWQEDGGVTLSGRPKSDADDYRYFPEPDLVPVAPDPAWIEELRATLPEMPAARRTRLQTEWQFTDLEMRDVVNGNAIELIEATVAEGISASASRKWWLGELARTANADGIELTELPVTPHAIAQLQHLVDSGRINDKLARQVLEGVLAGEGEPEAIVVARGLEVVSDDGPLLAAIDEALAAQPDVVQKVRDGKVQAAGAIVGAVMKATRGQADAGRVRELLMERING